MTEQTLPALILASKSQTRADMLRRSGLGFCIKQANIDEDGVKKSLISEGLSPGEIADALADMKARSVSADHGDALVIGADQILVKGRKIFSKAANQKEARDILAELSGGEHQLISTAVVYHKGQPVWRAADQVKLTVRPLSENFIESYLDVLGGDAFWSVGCYQLEGLGSQLFTKIEGDYFTVLGLPLLPLLDFLRRHGILAT